MNLSISALSKFPAYIEQLTIIRRLGGVQKVYDICLSLFKGGSGLFFLGYGTKEIAFDARQLTPSQWHLENKKKLAINTAAEYALAHGTLFAAAGICSILECLHYFSAVNLGQHLPIFSCFSAGLFLFANFVALEQNINLFVEAQEIIKEKVQSEIPNALIQMRSAFLGMISNLGYIMATAVAVMGASAGIAFLIGCVAACFGALKILHDFYFLYLVQNA